MNTPPWIAYAFGSMFFAGLTAVFAKKGLGGISAELGLTVRTAFVCVLVALFGMVMTVPAEWRGLTREHLSWLAFSAATTTLSWIFYYKALKLGEVSTLALIDKGSGLISILLAWWVLKEQITLRTVLGGGLIVGGLLVLVKR